MKMYKGRVLLAVLCAAFVFIEKATGQNIAQSSNQILQSSNVNTENVNYNTIQQGINLGRPTINFIPSVVNSGIPQGAQSISSVQQANVQQVSNNINPYSGTSSSLSSVSEQSTSSVSPALTSPSAFINGQVANLAGPSGPQQYQNVNQNTAVSQVQSVQNGQSVSTTSNQVAISNKQNVLPSYQNLPLNSYPFGGNFEIPLNLEISLPPVSIGVADQFGPLSTQPSSLSVQQSYNSYPYSSSPYSSNTYSSSSCITNPYSSNPYNSFPYLPTPYSNTGGCRSGIRDLLPIFLVALCNNNGGRCGGNQGGGCCNGCNNCIPVPVPIPIPFNPVIVKCGADDDADEEEDTGSKSKG